MKALRLVNFRYWGLLFLILAVLFTAAVFPAADDPKPRADDAAKKPEPAETGEPASGDSKIAQGKYLVHHVAQCIQCHTPRDARGELIESKLLQGAPIPITGPRYAQPWAAESEWIAGLGSYDKAFVRYLLTHGHKPDGSRPKSPMPRFQMNDRDADAVIAYLRSL